MSDKLNEATDSGLVGTIYQDSSFGDLPWTIYFYYLSPSNYFPGSPVVYMYNSGEEISGLDKLYTHIGKLIANARTGKKDPYPVGWDFGDIVWRKKSYIVVALDGYDIKFDPGNAMAIKQIGNGNKNYTFFDGNDDLYEMSNDPRKPDKVPIVYCLNHLRADENGRDWCPHEHQEVKFVFSHKPRNLPEKGGNLSDEGRNLLDGGGTGTNMGPPVPPPERKAGKNDEK